MKKYHGKTPEDLQQYWHDNPSTSGGIEISSWAERVYPKIILPAIFCVAVLGFLPMLLFIRGSSILFDTMVELQLFCDDYKLYSFWSGASCCFSAHGL